MPDELYDLLVSKRTERDAQHGIPADTKKEDREKISMVEEYIYQKLASRGNSAVSLTHREAITTRDYPQLLYRVINDRVLLPTEPDYIGQALLATTINVGKSVATYSIPAFGYLEAKEVGETAEYPEQTAELNRNATSIAIKKYGIRVAVSAEMMAADELGLFGLHILAAKAAMNRKKEEVIFSLFTNVVRPVFDNSLAFTGTTTIFNGLRGETLDQPTDLTWCTSGKDINGDLNATLHLFDIIDTMSVLLARGYEPSEMLVNPLAWPIMARDPVLNGFYLNGRWALPQQIATSPVYSSTGPADMNKLILPWDMTLHVTPFVRVNTPANGLAEGVPYLTDIYIGSRRNGVLLLQGTPLTQDAYTDFAHEIYNVRLREHYGAGLADMGRSWASLKNVRIDRAYEAPLVRLVS